MQWKLCGLILGVLCMLALSSVEISLLLHDARAPTTLQAISTYSVADVAFYILLPLLFLPLYVHLVTLFVDEVIHLYLSETVEILARLNFSDTFSVLARGMVNGWKDCVAQRELRNNKRNAALHTDMLVKATFWRSAAKLANHLKTTPSFLDSIDDEHQKATLKTLIGSGQIGNLDVCLNNLAFQRLVVGIVLQERQTQEERLGHELQDQTNRTLVLEQNIQRTRELYNLAEKRLQVILDAKDRFEDDNARVLAQLAASTSSNYELEMKLSALNSQVGELKEEKKDIQQQLESQILEASRESHVLNTRLSTMEHQLNEIKEEKENYRTEIKTLSERSGALFSQLASSTKSESHLRKALCIYQEVFPRLREQFVDLAQVQADLIKKTTSALQALSKENSRLKALEDLSTRVDANVTHLLLKQDNMTGRDEQSIKDVLGSVIAELAEKSALRIMDTATYKRMNAESISTQGMGSVGKELQHVSHNECIQTPRSTTISQIPRLKPIHASLQASQYNTPTETSLVQSGKSSLNKTLPSGSVQKRFGWGSRETSQASEVPQESTEQQATWLPGLGEPPVFARRAISAGQNASLDAAVPQQTLGRIIGPSASPGDHWLPAASLHGSRNSSPIPGQQPNHSRRAASMQYSHPGRI